MSRVNDRQFLRARKKCITALHILERKFKPEIARSAMRKHLLLTRQAITRVKKIAQLRRELAVIRAK